MVMSSPHFCMYRVVGGKLGRRQFAGQGENNYIDVTVSTGSTFCYMHVYTYTMSENCRRREISTHYTLSILRPRKPGPGVKQCQQRKRLRTRQIM